MFIQHPCIEDPHRLKKRKLYENNKNLTSYTAQKNGKYKYKTVIISDLTGYRIVSKFYIEFPLCMHTIDKTEQLQSYQNKCPVCFKFQTLSYHYSYCCFCHQSYPNNHDCSLTRPLCSKTNCENKISMNNFGYCKKHMNPTLYTEKLIEIMENYLIFDIIRHVLMPYLNVYTEEEQIRYPEYATHYEKMNLKKRKQLKQKERIKKQKEWLKKQKKTFIV